MKPCPSNAIASCVITIKKVVQRINSPGYPGVFAVSLYIYIYYIYSGNNDALTPAFASGGILRAIICVIFFFPRLRRNPRKLRRAIIDAHNLHSMAPCAEVPGKSVVYTVGMVCAKYNWSAVTRHRFPVGPIRSQAR